MLSSSQIPTSTLSIIQTLTQNIKEDFIIIHPYDKICSHSVRLHYSSEDCHPAWWVVSPAELLQQVRLHSGPPRPGTADRPGGGQLPTGYRRLINFQPRAGPGKGDTGNHHQGGNRRCTTTGPTVSSFAGTLSQMPEWMCPK
jgi:hypothetical protein